LHSKKVPCIFITHQLTVLSGKTTWISSKLHQYFIQKFNECWVPDVNEKPNLSGKLGHLKSTSLNLKYIGVLSRLKKVDLPKKYDLMVLLSGPEPQRSILEEKIVVQLDKFIGKIVFVKGRIEAKQVVKKFENTTFYNYMQSEELEKTLNESEMVLCRSGYTTLMDLAKLQKKAFFIPTPGQTEQEYLAKRMKNTGILPMSKQENFKIEDLNSVLFYKGFSTFETVIDWKNLFLIFN
jgi:predicted glycosyltransferase